MNLSKVQSSSVEVGFVNAHVPDLSYIRRLLAPNSFILASVFIHSEIHQSST